MLKSKSSESNPSAGSTGGNLTTIASGVQIKGDIICKGSLRVDGEVQGNVSSNGRVVLGSSGKILGDVQCDTADLEGFFKGKLNVKDLLTLKATSKIEGEVKTEKLAVEQGSLFNATIQMGSSSKSFSSEESTATVKV